MDAFYTPLNAKGTCFRIVIVAPIKTPKHIKTKTAVKKNWEDVWVKVCLNKGEYFSHLWREKKLFWEKVECSRSRLNPDRKYFKSLRKPCHLTFPQEPYVLSTHSLLINIKSKLVQCESNAIQPNMEPFQLIPNIGNPEMSDITGNEW